MKRVSTIAIILIIGSGFISGNLYASETKLFGSFSINITDLNALPNNSSENGEYVAGFGFPNGKTPFYCNVVARQGTAANTFQLGVRTTKFNETVFSETNLPIDHTCAVALSIEKLDKKKSVVAKLWLDPNFHQPEPAEHLSQRVELFPFSLTELVFRVSTRMPSPVNIFNVQTSLAWGAMALPVELTSFTASAKSHGVELAWKTATEVNNHGFEVERATMNRSLEGNGSLAWTKIGFVEGHGTTNAPKEYSFTDNNVSSGTFSYRLKQIDRDGQFEYSQEVEVMISQMPQMFTLMQNYPNPFNPSTQIRFAVPASRHGGQAGFISLKVYDVIGNEVASLVNGVVEAGEHTAQFNASQLPSGMYFYTIRANNFTETKKMTLVK